MIIVNQKRIGFIEGKVDFLRKKFQKEVSVPGVDAKNVVVGEGHIGKVKNNLDSYKNMLMRGKETMETVCEGLNNHSELYGHANKSRDTLNKHLKEINDLAKKVEKEMYKSKSS